MRALIIGGAGFVGNYLASHLLNDCKWDVCVTKLENESFDIPMVKVYNLNILDSNAVKSTLTDIKPNLIFHLAAQSSVKLSWSKPNLTTDININGTINVLEAIKELLPMSTTLLIGSGEEYGPVFSNMLPITEAMAIHPGNIYAATKATQNMLGNIYSKAYKMNIISVRAFNHIGPKQLPQFVVSDFCKQVAEIEAGIKEPLLKVGNLRSKRDFTDVRDIVRAYSLLIINGKAGETYNIGTGKSIYIQDLLDLILLRSKCSIKVEIDSDKFRPIDVPDIYPDITKLQAATNWYPKIPLVETIEDTLNYWRDQISITM